MRTPVPWVLAAAVLGLGLAALPAQAVESRVGVFAVACDGASRHVEFNASKVLAGPTQFVQGVEVSVIDPRRGLLEVVVRLQDDETRELVRVGSGSTRERVDFISSLVPVTQNSLGQVPISIDASCTPGAPIQGIVTVYFFS